MASKSALLLLLLLPFALAIDASSLTRLFSRGTKASDAWESFQNSKDTTPKYFQEAGTSLELSHYDERFYHGEVGYSERRLILRGLIRSYLVTMHSLGYETWLAHGTLLGWWWNGQVLPWDSDLDVQVSNVTIAQMAGELNMTSHTFNYTDVNGDRASRAYLVDVNAYWADMDKGNGDNVIDARWVDKETGMYIDITALQERSPHAQPGRWSCKNKHKYATQAIWPLRTTEFEGVRASAPRDMEGILVKEYGRKSLVKEDFAAHKWNHDIKEWVKKSERYLAARKGQVAQMKIAELRRDGRLDLLEGVVGDMDVS